MENIFRSSQENILRNVKKTEDTNQCTSDIEDMSTLNPNGKPKRNKGPVVLQKSIGFSSSVGIIVGGIIGSGIFISPMGVLQGSGSVGLTLIIWVICGLFAALCALAFSELGTLINSSGGEYIYELEGLAPTRRTEKLFWGPLLPFLYSWTSSLILGPGILAVKALACAEYIIRISSMACSIHPVVETDLQIKLITCLIVALITFLNCYSVNLSTRLINVFTTAKIAALLFIIVFGMVELTRGNVKALKTGFDDTAFNFDGLSVAFFSGIWAYDGWECMNFVVGEMTNPKRDLVKAVFTSLSIVMVLYMFVNVAYFVVLSKEEFLASTAVSVDFAEIVTGRTGAIFILISVAASIFGSTLVGVLTRIRVSYVAAREGHMVDCLSFIHTSYMTPTTALVFNCCISMLMVSQTSILRLLSLIGFLRRLFNIGTMVALLKLRKTAKRNPGSYRAPTIVPYIVIVFSLFILVTPFVQNPNPDYFYALLFLLIGFVVYVAFVYKELRVPGFDKVSLFSQKLFLVVPPEDKTF